MSPAVPHISLYPSFLCLLLLAAGCAPSESRDLPESYLRVVIDKDEPAQLLRYYLGGYVSPQPADPFEAGLAERQGSRLYVNTAALEKHYPDAPLADIDANGRLDWEEFERFIDETYYHARSAPRTLDSLRAAVGLAAGDEDWMTLEVDGVMTTARRRIFIREAAIIQALRNYERNGEEIIYPAGTTIVGEHYLNDRRAETTVMRKREDGFWDFFVYGADGSLAVSTSTPPKELKSPVQCVGCHFGNKLFEPEESFPVQARPGPHGPRQIYVADSLRSEELVRFFDEHRKRSDTVLGLYSTIFVAKLQAQRRAGTLSDERAALLDSLEL